MERKNVTEDQIKIRAKTNNVAGVTLTILESRTRTEAIEEKLPKCCKIARRIGLAETPQRRAARSCVSIVLADFFGSS